MESVYRETYRGFKSLILRWFEADIRLRASGIKLNIGFNFQTSFARGVLLTRTSKLSIESDKEVKKVIAVNLNPNIP